MSHFQGNQEFIGAGGELTANEELWVQRAVLSGQPDVSNALKFFRVNAAGTGFEFASVVASGGTVTSVSVVTANGISGSVATASTTPAITLTLGAITPTSVNGLTITATTGTLTIAALKILTINNTLTFSGSDGSTLNIGTGGTLGTAAYTAATAYAAALGVDDNYVTDAEKTVIGNTSGTNSGDQLIFKTIAVSGQSDVVADTTADTLTLVAGSNITITTNATTDAITIAASGAGTPTAITIADEAVDTTCYVLFATAATGDLGPKSNAGLTFNSATGVLTATGFSGPLTGNVTGNASGTAATVTGATQAAITSAANLATVGTIGTGVWQGTTIKANYLQQAAADLGGADVNLNFGNTNGAFNTNLTIDGVLQALSIGVTGTRIANGFFTDLAVTNTITGSISGNAATVTTNANLTGHVTSVGNAAVLGSFTLAQLNTAVSDADIARVDAANTFVGASTASAWVLTSPTITTKISPTSDDGAPLGDTTHNFSDLFLASGAVINFANGDYTITHSTVGILTFANADAGSAGPTIEIFHDTASPAANDSMAFIDFYSRDSAANKQLYAEIRARIVDATSTTEAGKLTFGVTTAGAFAEKIQLTGAALSPSANDGNALGTTALSWSDLFLASGAVVNFANSDLTITHSTGLLTLVAVNGITMQSNDAGALGSVLTMYQNSASPAANDVMGRIEFKGRSTTPADIGYFKMDGVIQAATGGSEYGELILYGYDGAYDTYRKTLRILGGGIIYLGDENDYPQIISDTYMIQLYGGPDGYGVEAYGTTGTTSGSSGGNMIFQGGTGSSTTAPGAGGNVTIGGGTGGGVASTAARGGTISILAGVGGQNGGVGAQGGDIILRPGYATGSATVGNIRLRRTSVSGADAVLSMANVASTDKTFTFPNYTGTFLVTGMDTMTYAGTISLDITLARVHKTTTVNATGNSTINASAGGTNGDLMQIIITNDATSGKTITFGTNFKPNGTLVGTTSKTAVVSFVSDGTNWYECARVTGL